MEKLIQEDSRGYVGHSVVTVRVYWQMVVYL